MKSKVKVKIDNVKLVEKLSKLEIEEKDYFTKQFNETLSVVEEINNLDTQGLTPTNHVTNLSNVFREDNIDEERLLSQKEALSGSRCVFNGYFVVKAVFENE